MRLVFNMVSDETEPVGKNLEQSIIFKLKFLHEILELNPANLSEEKLDILSTIKQFADYNISAEPHRKLREYTQKVGSKLCLCSISCDLYLYIGGVAIYGALIQLAKWAWMKPLTSQQRPYQS